mgnify:CR=1 FL=1
MLPREGPDCPGRDSMQDRIQILVRPRFADLGVRLVKGGRRPAHPVPAGAFLNARRRYPGQVPKVKQFRDFDFPHKPGFVCAHG